MSKATGRPKTVCTTEKLRETITYTVQTAADALGLSKSTIAAVVASGELPAVRYPNASYIAGEDLFNWVGDRNWETKRYKQELARRRERKRSAAR